MIRFWFTPQDTESLGTAGVSPLDGACSLTALLSAIQTARGRSTLPSPGRGRQWRAALALPDPQLDCHPQCTVGSDGGQIITKGLGPIIRAKPTPLQGQSSHILPLGAPNSTKDMTGVF